MKISKNNTLIVIAAKNINMKVAVYRIIALLRNQIINLRFEEYSKSNPKSIKARIANHTGPNTSKSIVNTTPERIQYLLFFFINYRVLSGTSPVMLRITGDSLPL